MSWLEPWGVYVPNAYLRPTRLFAAVGYFDTCDIESQKSYGLSRPMSRGTLRLKSADPFEDPVMDPQYVIS